MLDVLYVLNTENHNTYTFLWPIKMLGSQRIGEFIIVAGRISHFHSVLIT